MNVLTFTMEISPACLSLRKVFRSPLNLRDNSYITFPVPELWTTNEAGKTVIKEKSNKLSGIMEQWTMYNTMEFERNSNASQQPIKLRPLLQRGKVLGNDDKFQCNINFKKKLTPVLPMIIKSAMWNLPKPIVSTASSTVKVFCSRILNRIVIDVINRIN